MPYELYLVLHIAGLAAMFAALGAAALAPESDRKLVAATHGTGLLIVLVSGFGMHAKLGLEGMPGWFLAKLLIWLVFGGLIAVARRAEGARLAVWGALPLLGAVAAWLAVTKPF